MIKYFMFSQQQMNEKISAAKKLGKSFTPGTVFVGTQRKQFTEILSDPKSSRFPDALIIISGELKDINYKNGNDY